MFGDEQRRVAVNLKGARASQETLQNRANLLRRQCEHVLQAQEQTSSRQAHGQWARP